MTAADSATVLEPTKTDIKIAQRIQSKTAVKSKAWREALELGNDEVLVVNETITPRPRHPSHYDESEAYNATVAVNRTVDGAIASAAAELQESDYLEKIAVGQGWSEGVRVLLGEELGFHAFMHSAQSSYRGIELTYGAETSYDGSDDYELRIEQMPLGT